MNQYQKQLEETIEIEGETLPEIAPHMSAHTDFQKKPWQLVKKGALTRREKVYFGAAVAVIVLVGGGLLFWIQNQRWADIVSVPVRPSVKTVYYSPLNGLPVADEAATKRAVTAVMIENSPEARPQSGLAEADVVFEAVAEGGITRFIALYQNARPSVIGPVRSLRAYYADWAAGFDPSVAHVGGSGDALAMIRSGNYGVDLDEYANGGSYWRATSPPAPHNVYTNFDKLDALNASKKHLTSSFTFAPRVNEKATSTPDATQIDLNVSAGIFSVRYAYNKATNSYDRKQGGVAHLDREKGQISPKVVVALKTPITVRSDNLHMDVKTTGSGSAFVFQNGTVTEGTWSKDSAKDPLVLKDKTGLAIKLNRGQTWISVIGTDRTVTWQ